MPQTITTATAGNVYAEIYKTLINEAPTLKGGFAKVMTRAKAQFRVPVISATTEIHSPTVPADNGYDNGVCGVPATKGTLTLGEKVVNLCDFRIYFSLCKAAFEGLYDDVTSPYTNRSGSLNTIVPAEIEAAFIELVLKQSSEELEQIIWQGDTTGLTRPLNLCDGWLKAFLADGDVVDVANTTLTATNIIAELNKVYAAINPTVLNKYAGNGLYFYVPLAVKQYLFQNLASTSVNYPALTYNAATGVMYYLGIEIVATVGMPANTMVCTYSENLWIGTDLVKDFDNLLISDTDVNGGNLSGELLMRGRFKVGVNYYSGLHIVYYH